MVVVAAQIAGNISGPAMLGKRLQGASQAKFVEDVEMLDRLATTDSSAHESVGEDEEDGDEEEEDEDEEDEEDEQAIETVDDADGDAAGEDDGSEEEATGYSEEDAEGDVDEDLESETVIVARAVDDRDIEDSAEEDSEPEADGESEDDTAGDTGADGDGEEVSDEDVDEDEDEEEDDVDDETVVKVARKVETTSSSEEAEDEEDSEDEVEDEEGEEVELGEGAADQDGDGDDSNVEYETTDNAAPEAELENDSDNEVEEGQGEDDDEETIKPIPLRQKARQKPSKGEVNMKDDESTSAADSDADSDEKSSADEREWEGESDAAEEVDTSILDPSRCIYCGEDEEHDPSEDYEEYMACAACGDNAHPQCARTANARDENLDPKQWRCPGCIESDIKPERPATSSPKIRRSSAPKIIRDLMPAQKGVIKPGSHSVFSQLILPEADPTDGSRALRKRKVSNESDEQLRTDMKRQKRSSSRAIRAPSVEEDDVASVVQVASGPLKNDGYLPRQARQSRARQSLKEIRSLVTVVKSTNTSLLLCFLISPAKLSKIAHEKKKRKRRERELARRNQTLQTAQVSHYPSIQSFTPFFAFYEKGGDENKTNPYGGILSATEADTTNTFPQASDRRRFEEARQTAEEEWRKKIEAAQAAENARSFQKTSITASKIKCISFGNNEIDTWHAAPYPEEYSRNRVLYICEFCLKYMNSDFVAWRHKLKCPARHPPGDEIYRDGAFSFFEVDGRKNPVYCQNLCLLAKLFLGSKTLYYDVEPFLFYVMTENDEFGCHFVGYFSKEKRPSSQNNVSCILVLPIHQRRGFGHLLIDFSYLLTRVEKKTGSPEKPLSDMGLVSYRSYWRLILCYQLRNQKGPLSISDISDRTGITADDVVCALEGLRALVRDPVTKTYALRLDYAFYRHYIDNYEQKGYAKLDPQALVWVPYIMGRNNMHYEDGPQIHTVARRENEDDLAIPEEGVQLAANGVSEKDYATGKFSEDMDTQDSDFPTPRDELDQHLALPLTPRARSKGSTPSTPRNETLHDETSPIPATRFEVFPPLPGSAQRRKIGRSLARSATRRGTHVRRGLNYAESPVLNGLPATTRKTRSKLGEVVTNGISQEDGVDQMDLQSHDRDVKGKCNGADPSANEDVLMEDE